VNNKLADIFQCKWQIQHNLTWMSDHLPILVQLTPWIRASDLDARFPFALQDALPSIRSFYNNNIIFIESEFIDRWNEAASSLTIDDNCEPEEMTIRIINCIHSCLEQSMRPRKAGGEQPPWRDEQVGRACQRVWRYRRMYFRTRLSFHEQLYKIEHNYYQQLISKKRFDYWQNILARVKNFYDLPFQLAFGKIKRSKHLTTILYD